MWTNILIGSLLIILTSVIHTAATMMTFRVIQKKHKTNSAIKRIIHVDLIVLTILLATILEALIWALTYIKIGSFVHFEEALYFSLVTYTTLGYGGLILHDVHRLLSAIQATNGVIMFGWSTAMVVAAIQKVYFSQVRN